MPKEDEVHECELLKYQGRYLEFCCEGKGNARWRLIHNESLHRQLVILQNVLFCPCCGKDLREGSGKEYGGKPELNRLLRTSV